MACKFLNPSSLTCFFFFFSFLSFLPSPTCLNFSFTSFFPTDTNISVAGGATVSSSVLVLTDSQILGDVYNNTGRVHYTEPIQLWDPNTNSTTNFTTYFDFITRFPNYDHDSSLSSGGFAFFLAPVGSEIPANSAEGWLGLFNRTNDGNPSNRIVAVEFDSFQDPWDPSNNHVGINVNSIVSQANRTWSSTISTGDTYGVQIRYNDTSKLLRVRLKDPSIPINNGSLTLSYKVDLRQILPEKVIVGFSASTGSSIELHRITKWNFTTGRDLAGLEGKEYTEEKRRSGGSNSKKWVVVLLIIGGLVVLVVGGAVLLWVFYSRNSGKKRKGGEDVDVNESIDYDFAIGSGPRCFTYEELVIATDGFSLAGKLGEGGFGVVYKGFLSDLNLPIAVKKISRGSTQGKKQYASEVKVISRLRHRNLVQLIGWSHGRGEFSLVYEFMPNGSLDYHLFGKQSSILTWAVRYKIAIGLASALLYLHEEWEQCVLHRDIKSSNVMLDQDFGAKLGDFGMARFIDHHLDPQTTTMGGSFGYLAPECFFTGKASKESDVYSFGVVALEIACGRKAVDLRREEEEQRLVEWVWELYGRGKLLDAVDERLDMDFDVKQMESLMLVGLWCAHLDQTQRPSIKQVMQVFNFEGTIPDLPSKMPVPVYSAPASPLILLESTSTTTSCTSLLNDR